MNELQRWSSDGGRVNRCAGDDRGPVFGNRHSAPKDEYEPTLCAGHNGVQSIIDEIGTQDFIRIRLGIGPKAGNAADYVLNRWSKEQSAALLEFVAEAVGALETVLERGFAEAAAIYN